MYGIETDHRQASEAASLVKLLRTFGEFAEAAVVVIVFAVAILVVGTPIALAVRALHDIALWFVRSL